MLPPDHPEVVVKQLIAESATCELIFTLEGRQVGRIEMEHGKVRHAEMTGLNSGSAVRVIRRLPSKTTTTVRHIEPGSLGPRTLNSGAWEVPG